MVTASLPAFPSHCFGKTTGGTPTLLCPRALWSREEDDKDKPGTNPKGAWLDLPPTLHPRKVTMAWYPPLPNSPGRLLESPNPQDASTPTETLQCC